MSSRSFAASTPLSVVRVTGADRVTYLEDVTTQRLEDLAAGRCVGALHLDAKGSVLATMDVVVLPDHLLLLVPGELVEHVTDVIGGRTFLLDATFEPTDLELVSVRGTRGTGLVGELVGLSPPAGEVVEFGDVLAIGRHDGLDVVGDAGSVEHVLDRLTEGGIRRGDEADLDDWRIRAGIPRWGREIVAGRLPEELGLLPSHVHLAKGCYPGQEAVARMWMLGQPRRRLALVTPVGAVRPGWETGEGRGRVEVTSVTSKGDAALAFVPTGTGPGHRFSGSDDSAVTVERIIGDTIDVPGHDPAVVRRRDRRRSEAGAQ